MKELVSIIAPVYNEEKNVGSRMIVSAVNFKRNHGQTGKSCSRSTVGLELPSMMANKLICMASGCTLKAYRRDVIKDVLLYGEMHRFVPAYCSSRGGQA
jgi:hypothetical protein